MTDKIVMAIDKMKSGPFGNPRHHAIPSGLFFQEGIRMADTKKHYYLKLKDDFFTREEIKVLESQDNGHIYANLYLKLCLMSLKGEGRPLSVGEVIVDEKMISAITGIAFDNVKIGLSKLKEIGLIKLGLFGEITIKEIT